LEKLKK